MIPRAMILRPIAAAGALAVCVLPGPALAQPEPQPRPLAQPQPSADEAVYRQRLATFLRDPGNFPYAPIEAIAGAAHWQPLPTRSPGETDIAPAALDRAIAYAAANHSTALIVWHAGRIATAWYGPATGPSTPLVSKVLSKPLAAIALGRAISLGRIHSLDQALADFIPQLRGTQKGRILLRYLLDMRSGMLDQGFSTDPEHPYNRSFLDPDHGQRILDGYRMIAKPGTRYSYANAPSDLVAMVIERATGRRYAAFLADEILRPLGAQGGSICVDRPGGLAHSGCCARLPADTWLRLAMLLLDDGVWHGGRLLPPGYVAQMRRGTPQNASFGMGLWLGEPYRQRHGFGAPGTAGPQVLQSEPYLDPDLFMFDGNSDQTVQVSPRDRLIVLRMGPTPPASPEWDNAILPNLLIRGLVPAPPPPQH